MALSFPRDLRTSGIVLRSVRFTLARSIATAKLPAGLQAMETGVAVWKASIQCRPEHEHGRRRAAAFVDALSGTGTFLCYSPAECWPAAHPGGAIDGAWSDTLDVTMIATTAVLAAAPNANLQIRPGDMVGLEESGRYGLFRALADAAPDAGILAIEVAPRIPSFFTTAAVLRLYRPVCEMILDPTSEPDLGEGLTLAPVSWQAIQKVA